MTITANAVVEAVVSLVEEQPWHIYQAPGEYGQCMYVHKSDDVSTGQETYTAGCLIAQALVAVGVPITDLIPFDTECGKPARHVLTGLGIEASAEQREWLDEVQRGQDRKHSWGRAFEIAGEAPRA